jgi:type IV secretory pathway VirB4 component
MEGGKVMDADFIMQTAGGALKGNPSSDAYFAKLGSGYLAMLHVHDFPIYPLDFWVEKLLSHGAEVTIGYELADKMAAIESIGKSKTELGSRWRFTTDGNAGQSADEQIADLDDMYELIERGAENIANVFITLQLHGMNPYELLEKVAHIQAELQTSQFEVTFKLFENKMMYDFVRAHNIQTPIIQYGKQMPLSTFVRGLSFRQQSFVDTTLLADFLGYSHSGGVVMVDTWLKNEQRLSFDEFYTGRKGSGKSTALKIKIINNFKKHVRQFVLDAEAEYATLVSYLGGRQIDGSKEKINLLQVDELWLTHLSNLTQSLEMLFPQVKNEYLNFLKRVIIQVYKAWNIDETTDFLTLKPTDFPTFSDVHDYLIQLMYTEYYNDLNSNVLNPHIKESQIQQYFAAEQMLGEFLEAEYAIFNGHTTFDLDNEELVCFDISEVVKWHTPFKQTMYFKLTSMMFRQVEKNRSLIDREIRGVRRVAIVLDECHHLLKTESEYILKFVETLLRRGRKYLAGIIFATQRLSDLLPSGEGKLVDIIQTIFFLVEYKYIMQVDEKDLELIELYLPHITEAQRKMIRTFDKYGDCLLNVGQQNITFRFFLPPVYEDLMDGQLTIE